MDALDRINRALEEGAGIKNALAAQSGTIKNISDEIIAALKSGGKLIAFGNGGSASDSQHLVGELVGRFNREKRPLPAISLASNTAIITAIGNDYGYDFSFSKQLEALGRPGDIVVAISTSGNSKNVLEAVSLAKKMKLRTIGLSGKDGGRLAASADLCLVIPSKNTARIQEAHITIIHIICELIEEAFIAGPQ